MSLPLNQTNPQLNDLLLRGGSSLSPELKEQAIDDILAEFGSAPTKKAAKQAVPAQKQPASPAPSAPLVIDGVDFSEFLDNAPASRKTAAAPIPDPQPIREPVKTPEANKPPAPEKSAVTEDVPAPDTAAAQPAARRVGIVSILLRIFAFAAALATAGFLYTQTMQNRQSSASFDAVSSAVLQSIDLTDMQEADAQIAAARAETQAARAAQVDAERRSREEREQDRGLIAQAAEKDAQLRTAERKAAAAQAEAAEAKEQHRAAVAALETALETARRELRDTEELLAESQSEYDRLQGEMLNARSEKAKGDAERSISEQLTGDDFAAAVRLFLGSAAQVPYMGGQFARLEAGEYEQWDSLLKAIEDWAQRARNALDGKERIIDGR